MTRLTKVQKELIALMSQGHRLWSYPSGFELHWHPKWPRQKNTVRRLIDLGYIVWDGRENASQREAGILSLGLSEIEEGE